MLTWNDEIERNAKQKPHDVDNFVQKGPAIEENRYNEGKHNSENIRNRLRANAVLLPNTKRRQDAMPALTLKSVCNAITVIDSSLALHKKNHTWTRLYRIMMLHTGIPLTSVITKRYTMSCHRRANTSDLNSKNVRLTRIQKCIHGCTQYTRQWPTRVTKGVATEEKIVKRSTLPVPVSA